MDETGREQIRHREFRGIAVRRALLVGERLPETMHRAFRDLADDFGDILRLDAARAEPPRAIDIGLRHRPAGIGLERQRIGDPARTEIAGQRGVVAMRRMRKAVEEAMHALEHRARSDKARARQQRRAQARLRGPAGMQPLGPGALGEIFDDAAGHAAGDAERIDDLLRVEAERRADASRGPHRAEDRGRMKARFVHGLRHHEAEPAQHLGADGNAGQRHAAVRIVPLAGREHRRHDHRAGMHRAALERVVKILAMRGRAVDEGRARRRQRPLVADRGAGTVIVAAAAASSRHNPRCAR